MTLERLLVLKCVVFFSISSFASHKEPDNTFEKMTSFPKNDVTRGLSNFASHLYQVIGKSSMGNVFLSPFSIAEALAMTLAGSHGNTEEQMKQVLKIAAIDSLDIHTRMKHVRTNVRSTNASIELNVANRIFIQEGFDLFAEFVSLLEEIYESTCIILDFEGSQEKSTSTINQWVSEATKGKIKNIIDPKSASMTALVIANAVYFKSAWSNPFDKTLTTSSSFHTSSGQVSNVKMMHMIGHFKFFSHKTLESDFLWLPYVGNELSMLVILPHRVDGLTKVEEAFGSELLETATNGATKKKVSLWLPKFTLEETYALEQALKSMGMIDLFDPGRANLSKLSEKQGLYVSSVVHKTFVEVGEEGTEAAAATTVRLMKRSLDREEIVQFKADHPFMFCIIHELQNVILFIGALKAPISEGQQHEEL